MKILLTVIMTWLSANFDLPARAGLPDVSFVTQQEMVEMRQDAAGSANALGLVAVYDDGTGTVLLPVGWNGASPAEISILVHELVHHLQNVAGLKYACSAAREELAYAAQDKWLGLFGQSLLEAFGIDRLTLKVRTACM